MNEEIAKSGHVSPDSQLMPETFQAEHRKLIRQQELNQVVPLMSKSTCSKPKVLEIGAGAGWQAKILSSLGFDVTAIDIESSNYNPIREWPVSEYDGSNIALPSGSMDIVFSSNVLEHVPHIEEFQKEMQRVLKPSGVAIHVMPTPTWRIATIFSFYMVRIAQLLGLRKSYLGSPSSAVTEKKKSPRGIRSVLIPSLHGVRGNLATESYYFSERYWRSVFSKTGWTVESVLSNKLFYSGNRLFGHSFPLPLRKIASNIFGGSCKIYVLRKGLLGTEINKDLIH